MYIVRVGRMYFVNYGAPLSSNRELAYRFNDYDLAAFYAEQHGGVVEDY